MDKTVATFKKNKFQEVRVGILEFKGNDLIDIGLPPGPLFGRILDELEQAQVAGEVTDRHQALQLARDFLNKESDGR